MTSPQDSFDEEEMLLLSEHPHYSVTPDGEIYSWKTRRFLKLDTDLAGYRRVMLSDKGIRKHYFVHRLVAKEFIPNPLNKPCVNHKDNSTNNNNFRNLEWATYSENTQYAVKQGRMGVHLKLICINGHSRVNNLDTKGTCRTCTQIRGREYQRNRTKLLAEQRKLLEGGKS